MTLEKMTIENGIKKTLEERRNRYGDFKNNAEITQILKVAIREALYEQGKMLSYSHQEALEMILHKIGRIISGDPNYKDSWHDIAGYAKLAEDSCENN